MHKNTAYIYQRPIELIGGTFIKQAIFVWLANVDSLSQSTRFVAASQYAFMNVGPW